MRPNKDTASHFYERLLFVLTNTVAFIPIVMIPLGLLAQQGLAESRYYTSDAVFGIITAAYIVASALYFIYKDRVKQNASLWVDIAFFVVFHFLMLMFTLFVAGFLSFFMAVWIVLIVSTDLRFGIRGFLASFVALNIGGWLGIILYPSVLPNDYTTTLQGIIAVGLISFVIARIRAMTDRERDALAKTKDQEAYERERLMALVNSMGDAVVATDDQGHIKVYNSTLLSLLDTNLSLAEKPIDKVLKFLDKNQQPVNILNEAREHKGVLTRTDLSYMFSEGEVIKLYVNVAPIQPSYQSRTERGYIFILRDITKEKTLEEERDEFVSVVSHELRTPVTIAEGNLSNIKLLFDRGADKAAFTNAVNDAYDQIIYLAKLINDLATLARAERGTGGEAEVIDLSSLLHEIYANYMPQAAAKSLQFNIDLASHLPKVKANKLYLQEVLQNLITNAIKYTQQGSVSLKAQDTKDGVLLQVSDTGIGISKSDQQHIFEKFYRSEDYRTRETNGTGLGLYVCKKLAEKLGYKLSFESRLNHGTTFSLLISASDRVVPAPAQLARAAPVA